MSEETKVDKDYLEAFNLGYELAKELSLKSPMFKDMNPGNDRMIAMQAGMIESSNEIKLGKANEMDISTGLEFGRYTDREINTKKNKGIDHSKGPDLSI